MLYLIRCAEIGAEPKERKSKLKNDILKELRAKLRGMKYTTDFGRIFLTTEKKDAEKVIKEIHGISSFSPAEKCKLEQLNETFLALVKKTLKGKKRFAVKVKRVGEHKFSSQELAGQLGEIVLKWNKKLKVDFKKPEEMLFVEIRNGDCYLYTKIIPGCDYRKEKLPAPSPQSLFPIKFIADDMLGKLARRLRLLGFDVAYPKNSADSQILRLSREEGRIILTRDTGIVKIYGANAVLINSIELNEQLKEVIGKLGLKLDPANLFSRCTICNSPLEKIEKEKAKKKVPPLVYKIFDNFTYCLHCKQVFWKGTHFEKLEAELKSVNPEDRY